MRTLPKSSDTAMRAVRAGARLGRGQSMAAGGAGGTLAQRIAALLRRQVEGARSMWLCFSSRSKSRVGLAAGELALDPPPRAAEVAHETEVIVPSPFGGMIVPTEDQPLLTMMLQTRGVLEPGTTMVLSRLIRDGDTVVDVGAHIGLLTVPAARRVGPRGRVIAFEPLPRLADVLKRNIERLGLTERVTVLTMACAAQPGTARLNVGRPLGHSSLVPLESAVGAVAVTLCALDDVLPPGQAVTLVKIDAEGYEIEVWRGMKRVVADNAKLAVIVEFGPSHLIRAGISIRQWLDEFGSRGFRAYEIEEGTGRTKPLRGKGLDAVLSMNLLFVRNPEDDRFGLELA